MRGNSNCCFRHRLWPLRSGSRQHYGASSRPRHRGLSTGHDNVVCGDVAAGYRPCSGKSHRTSKP